MSKNSDPVKRAEKRRRQREAKARGSIPTDKRPAPSAQMTHASSGRAIKKHRDMTSRKDNQ